MTSPLDQDVTEREITVEMDYPGGVVSVNRYKYRGGIYTRPETLRFLLR